MSEKANKKNFNAANDGYEESNEFNNYNDAAIDKSSYYGDYRERENNSSIIELTEAGLAPSDKKLKYEITTIMVEKYFQRKLNVIIRGMRNSGIKIDDVHVRIVTLDSGSRYVPFGVLLPMSVLEDVTKPNEDECAYFQNESEKSVKIKKPIMSLFSNHMYSVNDESQQFNDPNWRKDRGIKNSQAAANIKKMRVPTIQRMNNTNMVTFILDPIRVFYHMLRMPNNKAEYKVEIEEWKRFKSGEYLYKVNRILDNGNGKKNKNNGSYNIADIMNRRMSGDMK